MRPFIYAVHLTPPGVTAAEDVVEVDEVVRLLPERVLATEVHNLHAVLPELRLA